MRYLLFFLLLPFTLLAQRPVTGTVLEAGTRDPLIGVSVDIRGTSKGTVTDLDGNFSLTVPDSVTLRLSYTGYTETDLRVGPGQRLGSILLEPGVQRLEEVVVTGYGVQRKMSVSGLFRSNRGRQPYREGRPESYNPIRENGFVSTRRQPVSTLSADVDRASYANVRRFLMEGTLPPTDAVRSEEMINYFAYEPAPRSGDHPLSVASETGPCPWNPATRLLRIQLSARELPAGEAPPANLVFLLDVSGSMQGDDRLGLVRESLKLLTDKLRARDRVAIVVYAGAAGVVLPSTTGDRKTDIRAALNRLTAGGSTAGEAGIKLAYGIAREHFVEGGNNRIILATDGDFNVGIQRQNALVKLIERERESGVYLTVLGVGRGNYQEGTAQELANRGNGNHAYLDGIREARKVLVEEFTGTLVTVAKDVKLQLTFDPRSVASYRLIGYENRLLEEEDFRDDRKDAGEVGAGHQVTMLYEITPTDRDRDRLGTLALRYKRPEGGRSIELTQPVARGENVPPSSDLRWAAAVAEFAMLLRDSPYREAANWRDCLERGRAALGPDPGGYRAEMLELLERTATMAR